jgi:hypothetical protein
MASASGEQNKVCCGEMTRRMKQEKGKIPTATMATLLVVLVVVFNINQMLQLESASSMPMIRPYSTTEASTTTAVSASLRKPSKALVPYINIPLRPEGTRKDLVKAGDYIYYRNMEHWDASPIVIESHKLIFFSIPKVGCTVWKQLFRRMMGLADWKSQDGTLWLPHNPEENGLKYLYDYSLEQASEMMTSTDWVRAVMVRDPKQRFLSAFLDKALSNDATHIRNRCCHDGSCVPAAQVLEGFLELCGTCEDDHWRSQHNRMDFKDWPYIDHIGHVENAAQDAMELLQRIGAWEEYGRSGWGSDGSSSIFESKGVSGAGDHATWSQWKVWKWYTPELEQKVEKFYQEDYTNPLFNFTRGTCLTCPEASS